MEDYRADKVRAANAGASQAWGGVNLQIPPPHIAADMRTQVGGWGGSWTPHM